MTCDFLWCRRASIERTVEQCYSVKFYFKLGKSASETFELNRQAYGDDALSRTRVFEWHKMFNIRDYDSQPYRKTGNIIDLLILILNFLETSRDEKGTLIE